MASAMEDKVQEFREFDFAGSQDWADYFKKFDISGADYNGKLLKLKAKWYKKNIDEAFDVSLASDQGSGSAPSASSTKAMREDTGEQTPSRQGSSSPSPPPNQKITRGSPIMLFLCHTVLLLLALLCLLPFSTRAMHQYFLLLAIVTHGLKVLNQFGRPPFWPWSALQAWAVTAIPSTDFQYVCMSLVFVARIPTRLVFVPSMVLAAYHVDYYLASKYSTTSLWKKYGQQAHVWMMQNQRAALSMNATTEIGVGILLIVQLLAPARNLLSIFIYWQWLRTRYFSPDAAQYHRVAWHKVGQRVNPLLQYVPFLKVPVGYATRWFTTAPTR